MIRVKMYAMLAIFALLMPGLLCLIPVASVSASDTLLTDNFDDGNANGWTLSTSGGAVLTVSSAQKYSGGYSLYTSTGSGSSIGTYPTDIDIGTPFTVSFYFYGTTQSQPNINILYFDGLGPYLIWTGYNLNYRDADGTSMYICTYSKATWRSITVTVDADHQHFDVNVAGTNYTNLECYAVVGGDINKTQIGGSASASGYWDDFSVSTIDVPIYWYAITSEPVTTCPAGTPYEYQAVCNGTVSEWSISGQEDLEINETGFVSGDFDGADIGSYSIQITGTTELNTVYQNYTLYVTNPNAPADVAITISGTSGYEYYTIYANGTATGNLLNYTWTTGNGYTYYGTSISHTYVSNGIFILTLNVSNPAGYGIDTETITVLNLGFTSSPVLRAYNETEYVYDFVHTGGTVSGDTLPNGLAIEGGILHGTLPSVLGDYPVSLKLTNNGYNVWQNFTIKQVDVPPTNPEIIISGDIYLETYSLVEASGTATGKNLNYTWYWHDLINTVTYGQNTSSTYLVSGNYDLELVVSNTGGSVSISMTLHVLNFQFTTEPETLWRLSAGEYHYRPNATTAYLGGNISYGVLPYGFYVADGLIYGTFDSEGLYNFSISAILDERTIYQNWTVRAYADFIPIDWSNDRIMDFVASWAVIIISIVISAIGLRWNIGLLCIFGTVVYILAVPVMWTGETLQYIAILAGALFHVGLIYKKFF